MPAIAADQSARLARRIVDRLADPMSVAGITLTIGASVGISIMPVDGATAANVLRAADLAMYRAKADGRGTFRFFETAMDADLRERSALEADLRAAFDAGQIEPCYDPVVELASRRVVGYETRARWHHPGRGLVPPEIFLPVLDQLGALGRMTEALMQHAVRDAARMPGTYVAIDVPHRQVQDVAFPTILGKILLSADFPPNRLEIEVSETALEGDDTALRSSLEALRTLGVRVVLNGFGSGRASLPRLRDFRFDKIKIGQDLIAGMAQDPAGKAVLEAVLGLARDLDIAVVAADVATEAMAEVLASRGCALGQGPLFRLDAADALRARPAARGRLNREPDPSVVPEREALLELGLLRRGGFPLVHRLPGLVGHAVDLLPRFGPRQGHVPLLRGLLDPVRQAVPAEAREGHEVDVLHVRAGPQVRHETAEGRSLEFGLGGGVEVGHGASSRSARRRPVRPARLG